MSVPLVILIVLLVAFCVEVGWLCRC